MTVAIVGLQLQAGKYQIAATWGSTGEFPPGYAYVGFQVEYSTASDMSGSTTRTADGSYLTFQAVAGETYYVRVRARAQYRTGSGETLQITFVNGEWSDIESATEPSDGSDPWSSSWVNSSSLAATFGSGSGTLSSIQVRTKQNGLIVFFLINFSISSLSSPSGLFRVGNIPLPLRSGGGPPVVGMRTGGTGQRMLVGKVVDAGSDETAVDLSLYDGSFAAVDTHQYLLSGFFETTV